MQFVQSDTIRFSLRLHFHTSCLYRLHESCSYRLFSLAPYAKCLSKMSQEKAKAVVIALISEKNKSRKKRKKRKVGIKLWLKKGETFKKLCLQTAVRRQGPKEGGAE